MPSQQETTQNQQQNQQVTQNQQQSSASSPWQPTQNSLLTVLNRLNMLGGSGLTEGQIYGNELLKSSANDIPNLGGDALNAVKRLFGSDTSGSIGMLNSGYADLARNIGGTASGAELDPYKTPGFADAITRSTNDITDRVKAVYNAAGRDPSGAGSFAGSLGRGLTEGIAPIIQSQFNTNNANRFAAANKLFDASGQTAGAITQQGQVPLENALKGISAAGTLPGLYMQPAAAVADAQNKAAEAPWQNISRWLQGVLPIAALGSQSQSSGSGSGTTNTTGQTVTTRPDSLLGNILGGASGLTGILGQTGAFAGAQGAGWLSSLLPALALSDERVKENISEIGETHDGQPLYSFNYIGDNVPRVGLMAQDVEKRDPGAVVDVGGVKAVDYSRALSGARRIGMMRDMLEAA